jgi:DNA-binding MarR family transcriptional regulator
MSLSSDIAAVLLEDEGDQVDPVMVVRAIRKTAKDLEHYIVRPLAQDVGLSVAEFTVLRFMLHHLMAGHGNVPNSALVRYAIASVAMLSRYMADLQERGFVERVAPDGADRKRVFFKLTQKGLDTVVTAEDRLEKAAEKLFRGVSDDTLEQYRGVLTRISNAITDPFGLRGS